jgi:hypothetical protein
MQELCHTSAMQLLPSRVSFGISNFKLNSGSFEIDSLNVSALNLANYYII